MPTVAIIDGVRVLFYYNDHAPPHFHVEFAGHSAQIQLDDLTVMNGSLPPGKLKTVLDWAAVRKSELMECWNKA